MVACNTTGRFHDSDADEIRSNLYHQIFQPVRWSDNLTAIGEAGVDAIIEFWRRFGDLANHRPTNVQTLPE